MTDEQSELIEFLEAGGTLRIRKHEQLSYYELHLTNENAFDGVQRGVTHMVSPDQVRRANLDLMPIEIGRACHRFKKDHWKEIPGYETGPE